MPKTNKDQSNIKSFVIRAGRLSPRQKKGLEQWLPHYQLPQQDKSWDLTVCFGRDADVILEIGFGMGQSFLAMAKANPQLNFLGIEVHPAGLGSLAMALHEENIQNVRIVAHDAVATLQQHIADQSLSGIQIFFPDPWPKARHQKRRLIQPAFVHLMVKKLKPSGWIHLATDWEDYAVQMLEVLSAEPGLQNFNPENDFLSRPDSRPLTKFEQRGMKLGHSVWDLKFVRCVSTKNKVAQKQQTP